MAAIRQRHNKWEARTRVPKAVRLATGGPELLYRTLKATDRRGARLEAAAWEGSLRAEWATGEGGGESAVAAIREIYQATLERAGRGELGSVEGYSEGGDAIDGGLAYELDRIEAGVGEKPLSEAQRARIPPETDPIIAPAIAETNSETPGVCHQSIKVA